MANLLDYLTWRGDIPFSADPFNEVDNLVLAWLAYSDFDGIVPSDGRSVSLAEVSEAFFSTHSREEILESTVPIMKAPLLLDGMLSGARFQNTKLCHYINEIDTEKDQQVSAVTFLLDDGTAYVAYRGTDRTIVGWREDFNFSFLTQTSGQQRAVKYLNEIEPQIDRPLIIGGHSKGGNFAVYAASFCSVGVKDRIIRVYSNDGPGFRNEILQTEGYQQMLPKVVSIVPEESVIGMLLKNSYSHRVVKSSESGIMQHDAMSWEIERNHFCAAELSEGAKFMDNVLDKWLSGMNDDTRSSFVDTIFSLLESTGQRTLDDLTRLKRKSTETMLVSLLTLPKDKQKELLRLVGQLLQTGGKEAIAQIAESRKEAEEQDEPENTAEQNI
ncbi:MAG: DUF2974 domain-containing protein [Oscillospiraceae bacterium]|nr:DUF2974 domain-containing protein [Oscillospiraceae bacterium]